MTALDLAGNGKAPSRADTLAQWLRALSVLLFLASVAALIFQLGWQGALVRRFGGLLSRRSPLLLLAAFGAMHGACGFVWPTIDDSTDIEALGSAFAVAPM